MIASPTDRCYRCGAGPDADLRVVVFRGRTRYAERTLCDTCAEVLLEDFIAAAAQPGARRNGAAASRGRAPLIGRSPSEVPDGRAAM